MLKFFHAVDSLLDQDILMLSIDKVFIDRELFRNTVKSQNKAEFKHISETYLEKFYDKISKQENNQS